MRDGKAAKSALADLEGEIAQAPSKRNGQRVMLSEQDAAERKAPVKGANYDMSRFTRSRVAVNAFVSKVFTQSRIGTNRSKVGQDGLIIGHHNRKMSDFAGTLLYTAPETLLRAGCDTRSEVFSFGVLIYELFKGVPIACMYESENQVHMHVKKILDGWRPVIPTVWPNEIRSLVSVSKDITSTHILSSSPPPCSTKHSSFIHSSFSQHVTTTNHRMKTTTTALLGTSTGGPTRLPNDH